MSRKTYPTRRVRRIEHASDTERLYREQMRSWRLLQASLAIPLAVCALVLTSNAQDALKAVAVLATVPVAVIALIAALAVVRLKKLVKLSRRGSSHAER